MMVKEIYDKFTSDIGGDDEEEFDSNEKGEDLKLENVNPDNNEKKKCC